MTHFQLWRQQLQRSGNVHNFIVAVNLNVSELLKDIKVETRLLIVDYGLNILLTIAPCNRNKNKFFLAEHTKHKYTETSYITSSYTCTHRRNL